MTTLAPTMSTPGSPRVPKHATQLSPEQMSPVALKRKEIMKGLPPPPMEDNPKESTGPVTPLDNDDENWAEMDIDGMIDREIEEELSRRDLDDDGDEGIICEVPPAVPGQRSARGKLGDPERQRKEPERQASLGSVDMSAVFYGDH